MFEGLNWKAAARRSAIVIGIYIALFYFLSVAFPRRFPFDVSLLPMVVIFFFVFTFVYAFVERNKSRRIEQSKKESNKPSRPEGDPENPSAFKGRPNPNTSRKKSRRKR
ncbi:MAG: hypothetical protein M3534_08880 [Actinomycetota bacterium]|nr:hypothetical protein [Actinomycetota bacterium]